MLANEQKCILNNVKVKQKKIEKYFSLEMISGSIYLIIYTKIIL